MFNNKNQFMSTYLKIITKFKRRKQKKEKEQDLRYSLLRR